MEPRISIITLGVSDLAKATQFYQTGLQLPYSEHSNENIAFFELQGTWLGLYPKASLAEDALFDNVGSGFGGITLAHNVSDTAQVDELLKQAEAAGGNIIKPAAETFWGGYSGYFSDLDGYPWEIAWNPHFTIT